MGWFCVEDDGNQMKKDRHPLLVGHVPVTVAKQQDFKVTGREAAARRLRAGPQHHAPCPLPASPGLVPVQPGV